MKNQSWIDSEFAKMASRVIISCLVLAVCVTFCSSLTLRGSKINQDDDEDFVRNYGNYGNEDQLKPNYGHENQFKLNYGNENQFKPNYGNAKNRLRSTDQKYVPILTENVNSHAQDFINQLKAKKNKMGILISSSETEGLNGKVEFKGNRELRSDGAPFTPIDQEDRNKFEDEEMSPKQARQIKQYGQNPLRKPYPSQSGYDENGPELQEYISNLKNYPNRGNTMHQESNEADDIVAKRSNPTGKFDNKLSEGEYGRSIVNVMKQRGLQAAQDDSSSSESNEYSRF